MTEEGWLACTDPKLMFWFKPPRAGKRKSRLFSCACSRRVWHLLDTADETSRNAVIASERFADRIIGRNELAPSIEEAEAATNVPPPQAGSEPRIVGDWAARKHALEAAAWAARGNKQRASASARVAVADAAWPDNNASGRSFVVERAAQAGLIREIFGNPFRPLPPRPEAIAPLAEQIYAGAW